ncbi:V-type proton ATPase subunit G 1-like [Anneissia japonica]|uniref:V-type proton ATPase subunit G 1-like n=1 Tax=Anneissia japonica TaxID=1529436 RepID=UPI0014255B3F|nr:V-type proton ATPase subunit G 1-like [Anneissia japonica]
MQVSPLQTMIAENVDHQITRTKMAAQTQGIQQLLQAEKRAAEKVSEAKKRKARRLKQAKEEAHAEIESYRKERDTQFAAIQQNYMGSKGSQADEIDKQTTQKIYDLQQRVNENRDVVLEQLFDLVFDIKATVHENARL